MQLPDLILYVLAIWRITHLLGQEDGPFDLIFLVRKKAGAGFFGSLLDCFYCLSLWTSFPVACFFASGWKELLLLWPALSGGACLLEKLTCCKKSDDHKSFYSED